MFHRVLATACLLWIVGTTTGFVEWVFIQVADHNVLDGEPVERLIGTFAAASFARRLLELPDMSSERNADLKVKATKVRQKSEQMARNEHQLNYDDTKTFTIDCRDFVPIYSGQACVNCSYCGSAYADSGMTNQICTTCCFSVVGIKTLGLVTG